MTYLFKSALLAGLIGAAVTAKAESYGDLIIGFTTQAGKDSMEDIGSVSSLVNGQTWNLANLITNTTTSYTTVNWGVIGNASSADSPFLPNNFTGVDTYYMTIGNGVTPTSIGAIGEGYYNAANTSVNAILGNFSGGQLNTVYPNTATISSSDPNSWNTETLSGTLNSDFVNSIASPNAVGQATAALWEVPASGAAPAKLGNFTLSTAGVLTFNTVSTVAAPVAGFSGTPSTGFAPLKTVFTDASTGSITNWVWNFGNGHSVTNLTSVSVTNTYAAAGSYTVSEMVAGPGGSNTDTLTAYVVVSATPTLGAPTLSGTNLVFGGTGGPAGVQYRILTSTNLATPIGNWLPVVTNTVSSSGKYGYTNSTAKAAAYFLLVSP